MNKNLEEKLFNNDRPKRILSLDGGGIRGTLTLGILKKIELLVKEQYGPKALLADYYDLISGTSTGAIIASGLAIGKSVDEIVDLYLDLGVKIFGEGRKWKVIPRNWKTFRAILRENYSSQKLESYLKGVLGETTIGDQEQIRCGLAINAKRADTYSLWTVANHPDGKYYAANAHLKLWELCRASSAAPYYFKPKVLKLKTREGKEFDAAFIDGGVSLANNPAWAVFLTSIVGSFGFKWNAGTDNLFITTIGTGNGIKKEDPFSLEKHRAIHWAPKLSDLFMVDALEMNQVLLEGMGNNIGPAYPIDSQFSDETYPPLFRLKAQLFSFERHNVALTDKALSQLDFAFSDQEINSFKEMDHFENMEALLRIGKAYAANTTFTIL